jgi:hypothetical protein
MECISSFVNEWIDLGNYGKNISILIFTIQLDYTCTVNLKCNDSNIIKIDVHYAERDRANKTFKLRYKNGKLRYKNGKLRYKNGKLFILFRLDYDYTLCIDKKYINIYIDNEKNKYLEIINNQENTIQDIKARFDLMEFWIKSKEKYQ